MPDVQVTATGRPLAFAIERDEAGQALIDHRHRLDPGLRRKGERQRSVPRPRRGHGVAHAAARELVHEGLDRRVDAVDQDHAGAMVLFIPNMQRGDVWRPVAELLPTRYPSVLLDHREHSFEGRLREIAEQGERRVLVGYSLGGRLALRAAARPGPVRRARDARRHRRDRRPWAALDPRGGRRAPCHLDGGGADRRRGGRLGAPAAVRRPVRDADRGAAARPPDARSRGSR